MSAISHGAAIHVEAELISGEAKLHGQVNDVSMRGLFLHCKEHFPEKTECTVELYLAEHALCISAKGRIVRRFEDGMGVEFTEIDLDSFEHLRNLVRMNANNVSQVEGEFKSHLGLKKSLAM